MENNGHAEWWCGAHLQRDEAPRPVHSSDGLSPTCDGQLITEGVTRADQEVEIASPQWRIVFIGPTRSSHAPPTCILRKGEKAFFFFLCSVENLQAGCGYLTARNLSEMWLRFFPVRYHQSHFDFFFFPPLLDGSHSRYFQRLQPVKKKKKRHLWAPSASTSIEITPLF